MRMWMCVDKCTQSIRYSNYFKSHLSRVCRGAPLALFLLLLLSCPAPGTSFPQLQLNLSRTAKSNLVKVTSTRVRLRIPAPWLSKHRYSYSCSCAHVQLQILCHRQTVWFSIKFMAGQHKGGSRGHSLYVVSTLMAESWEPRAKSEKRAEPSWTAKFISAWKDENRLDPNLLISFISVLCCLSVGRCLRLRTALWAVAGGGPLPFQPATTPRGHSHLHCGLSKKPKTPLL